MGAPALRNLNLADHLGAKLQERIDRLAMMQARGIHYHDLEWEIRLYQFMLKDPENRLPLYERMRYSGRIAMAPRVVAQRLGWHIE